MRFSCPMNPAVRQATSELPTSTIWDDPRLSTKVKRACATVRASGHQYIWIDSCCIDKTSSSELSEAINSMYAWYRDASVCYAFLVDVPRDGDPSAAHSLFRQSRWFKRGWTLQELIAPRTVVFLSSEWQFLGTKTSLADVISDVTGIDCTILRHQKDTMNVSVAERMSWAAGRETTRPEDEAYSLLGLFDINIPTLYGEGRRAFLRLQEEILKRVPDQSILVWDVQDGFVTFPTAVAADYHIVYPPFEPIGWFAESPSQFQASREIKSIPLPAFMHELGLNIGSLPTYTATPFGLPIPLPIIPTSRCIFQAPRAANAHSIGQDECFLALLGCEWQGNILAILCTLRQFHSTYKRIGRAGMSFTMPSSRGSWGTARGESRYVALSRSMIKRCLTATHVEVIYGMSNNASQELQWLPDILPDVHLAPWTADVLQGLGWTRPVVSQRLQRDRRGLVTHLSFSKGDTHLHISFQGVSGSQTLANGLKLYSRPSYVDVGVFNIPPESTEDYSLSLGLPACNPAGRLSSFRCSLQLKRPRHPVVFTFRTLPGELLSMHFTVIAYPDSGFCHLEFEILPHNTRSASKFPNGPGTPGLQNPPLPTVHLPPEALLKSLDVRTWDGTEGGRAGRGRFVRMLKMVKSLMAK
ncbi:hypothetical protein C8Q76DRAFT_860857 [Earliella scabrosa]|nr:hypothetical protein C8Q76DRAFT_860857 [Earliella scabrosa]